MEPIKPWRCSSAGASATQPRFRETVLKKPREPGEKLTERPNHEEYQTVAGVSFPAGTGEKQLIFAILHGDMRCSLVCSRMKGRIVYLNI